MPFAPVSSAGACWSGLDVEVELKATPMPDHRVVFFAGQVLERVDLSAANIDETTSLALDET